MSFDIYLVASSASPPEAAFEASVREAVAGAGGRFEGDGVMVRTPSGETVELFGGGMFALHDFGPGLCSLIFTAAERSHAYIVPTGGEAVAYRVTGMTGAPPADFLPVKDVAGPDELCRRLEPEYRAWRRSVETIR
jgi:hypothetical protein